MNKSKKRNSKEFFLDYDILIGSVPNEKKNEDNDEKIYMLNNKENKTCNDKKQGNIFKSCLCGCFMCLGEMLHCCFGILLG